MYSSSLLKDTIVLITQNTFQNYGFIQWKVGVKYVKLCL
jgi:hypothetical protein